MTPHPTLCGMGAPSRSLAVTLQNRMWLLKARELAALFNSCITMHHLHFLVYYFKWKQVWWNISIIPTTERQRQEDYLFKVNLSYVMGPCFKFLIPHTKKNPGSFSIVVLLFSGWALSMKSYFLPKGTELPSRFPDAAAQPLPSGSAVTHRWPLRAKWKRFCPSLKVP